MRNNSISKSLVPKLESMILEDNKEEEEDEDLEINSRINNRQK